MRLGPFFLGTALLFLSIPVPSLVGSASSPAVSSRFSLVSLAISVGVHLLVAIWAFRLIRISRTRWVWVVLIIAMLLMVTQRLTTWFRQGLIGGEIALAVSVLMLVGFVGLEKVFRRWRAAEEALVVSQSRLSTLLSHLPVVLHHCLLEPRWPVVYISDGVLGLTGYTAAELMDGRISFSDIILPEDRDQVWQETLEAFSRGSRYDMTFRIQTRQGECRMLRDIGQKIPPHGPWPESLEGILIDVTEQIRAEGDREALQNQLRQAQKMEAIGQLAGGVAHDFNNLLTAIMGFNQILAMKLGENHPGLRQLEQIQRAADRGSDLTRQLLAFGRRQTIQPRWIDLGRRVRELVDLLRRIIGENVRMNIHAHSDPSWVYADPGQIDQAVMNLVVNARDAMSGGGTLTVSVERKDVSISEAIRWTEGRSGPFVVLTVRDTGIGMSEEVKQRLFEPFFTTKGADKGTGLGLSTVYGIVKQHQGTIRVESQAGEGTTFFLFLPAGSPPLSEADVPHPTESPPRGRERILLVEDDRPVREMIETVLSGLGYLVRAYPSGEEALQSLIGDSVGLDLLLSDMVMPGLQGLELAEQLQARFPGMKVLLISGYTDTERQQDLRRKRFSFLQKPFSPLQLAQRIREVLKGD